MREGAIASSIEGTDLAADVCPLCGREGQANALEPFQTEIRDYEYGVERAAGYYRCGGCGLVVQRPAVSAEEIPGLYPDDYQAFRKPSSLFAVMKRWLVRRDARRVLAAAGAKGPKVLEIGCGNGALLEAVLTLDPAARAVGVDIKDLGLATHPAIEFHEGQLEAVALPEGSFDVVYFSNLIEHVVDPFDFLDRVRRLLKPGGRAILITPEVGSLDRRVFGRYWGGWHFPRHLHLFSATALRRAIDGAGLECESVAGGYAWWYISLANMLFEQSARRGRGAGFALVTITMLPFDLLASAVIPHGSLTAVARRPA